MPMFIAAIIHALLLFSANPTVSGNALNSSGSANLRASAASDSASASEDLNDCDESFPLARPYRNTHRDNTSSNEYGRRLVAIPPAAKTGGEYYETGEYYAPLCPDGRRIDLRKLTRCVNDQCFDEFIGHCTYVCSWSDPSPPQTSKPTMKPTPAPEVTEHPLLMDLRSLPEKYRMSEEVRAAIIRYMRDRLELDLDALGVGLELVSLSYPGRLPGKPHALPLKLEVEGPPDISDFALSYILEAANDANEEILKNLKRLDADGSTYQNAELYFSAYNPSEIDAGDTIPPSSSPTSSPTNTTVVIGETKAVVLDVEDDTGIPWWVWLIVALVILILCCCCCFCYRYRRDKRGNDKNASNPQTVNLFMQSRVIPKSRRKKGAERKRSQAVAPRSLRQPRSVAAESRRTSHRRPPRDDQTRRTTRTKRTHRNPRDDQTRRTTRTRQTRSRDEVQAPATSIVIHNDKANEYEDLESVGISYAETQTNAHYDAETGVSALSTGNDPPEEMPQAMVLYEPQPNGGERDHTMYTERAVKPGLAEPEGDKILKKQSVFATGAMMDEVHREKERKNQARRESAAARRRSKRRDSMGQRLKASFRRQKTKSMDPDSEYDNEDKIEPPLENYGFEGNANNLLMTSEPEGLTSDEMMVEQVNRDKERRSSSKKKKSKKKKKTKKEPGDASRISQQQPKPLNRKSSMDRLKASFSWRAPKNANDHAPPIDIDVLMDSSHSSADSPSILTNHNPNGGVVSDVGNNPYYRNYNDEEHDGGSHNMPVEEPTSSKKKKKKDKKSWNDLRRLSNDIDRDGVSSDSESFHVKSKGEEDNHDYHHHEQIHQRRESDSSYESV